MDATESSKPFVASFLDEALIDVAGRELRVWELGDGPDTISRRLERVLAGSQRATAGLLWGLEARGEPPPRRGDLRLLRNARGEPRAVVEILESQVLPFAHVDEHFAVDVGEGDLSLSHWRKLHGDAFERECVRLGRRPGDAMPVVCLRFRLVYPQLHGA
jgi:uncharacterized protein YhfF